MFHIFFWRNEWKILCRPATRGCFRSHVPFTPVFTLHGWLARHSGCLEKRNCHNCRNYFRLFPFAADWMENARCENLGLSRHHSGAQHNTEHLSSFVAETEKWKKHARWWNVFIAHCHSCTANTCIVMVTCFAAVSAQVHVHVTPWYSAPVTFSCLTTFVVWAMCRLMHTNCLRLSCLLLWLAELAHMSSSWPITGSGQLRRRQQVIRCSNTKYCVTLTFAFHFLKFFPGLSKHFSS